MDRHYEMARLEVASQTAHGMKMMKGNKGVEAMFWRVPDSTLDDDGLI